MTAVPNALGGFSGDPTGAGALFAGSDETVPPPADPSAVVAKLNALLRGEISAAETYRNVIDKVATHGGPAAALAAMQAEHGRSCQLLRERITELGGEPADGSGLWGVWAQTIQGTLSLFGGDAGGLRALHEGEEHGLRDYQTALNEVDDVSAQLIQDRLMPSQEKHLATLATLLK